MDGGLQAFYTTLLRTTALRVFHDGAWGLCECTGWPDNQSCQNLIAWNWVLGDERFVIVVNLSGGWAQARVHLPWGDALSRSTSLTDVLAGVTYEVSGPELAASGLYVELGPWGCHLFHCFSGPPAATA